MLKKNQGRVAVDSHPSNSVGKEERHTVEYQKLIQEFLDLQREKVSKKRKLQRVKQKRDKLLAEVRFLRWRHRYLMKMRFNRFVLAQSLVSRQNKRRKSSPTPDNLVLAPVIVPRQNENSPTPGNPVLEQVRVEKKPIRNCWRKDCSKKKKVSWQDQVAVQVSECGRSAEISQKLSA